MLLCNRCGQSVYINDENFREYRNVSGWEMNIVSPHDGEWLEFGDSENTDGDHDYYECPYCNSSDIDCDFEGTQAEALGLRRAYDAAQERDHKLGQELLAREQLEREAKDPSRQWDLDTNL